MKFKYVGYNSHRLKPNDEYHAKEIAFVEQINEELNRNGAEDFVDRIVNKKDEFGKFQYLTEEEHKAVLSAIQWLGTPVGEGFLERVNKRIKNGK